MNLSLIILLLFNFFLVLFPLPGLDEIIAALVVCNFLFVFCFTLNQEGKSVCSAYVCSWTGWLITFSNAVYLIIGLSVDSFISDLQPTCSDWRMQSTTKCECWDSPELEIYLADSAWGQ